MLNRVPHALTFEQTVFGWRLYFLSVPVGHRENTIFYIDFFAEEPTDDEKSSVATWCTLLDSFSATASGGSAQMSREEQLLRERKRQRSIGITSYDYQHSVDGGHFAFSAASSIYVCTDPHTQTVSVLLYCRPYSRLHYSLHSIHLSLRLLFMCLFLPLTEECKALESLELIQKLTMSRQCRCQCHCCLKRERSQT